ncbi:MULTISPECIES: lysylphosphatidylglycerol synthase transmembrane domain-containing protein [Caproicibacterium]|uniref:Phosphatidylglycerol lysyltransferase n=1 Tax=Caproicibacterium argilliputei TaxID=3030016 RepID=A0AA97D8S7_9FIRM|nr:lysylphosphatidylglycerol synthase transmembrane domain-containing protein [Caproicibacterium argilliputei]WOC31782.1 lysylphosphatidylglycerol synthase transmembrane domain-containing protein [Caproicibacterium argilliputei]
MSKFLRLLKKHLFTILVLSITMGILLFSLFREKSLPELAHIFSSLSPYWMLMAAATLVGTWLMEALCNWLLCRHLYPGWTYGKSFMIGITGIFYACITPAAMGAQPMQIYYMSKMGMEGAKSAAIISAKTITHQTTMVVFSLILICTELPFFVKNVSNLAVFTVFGLATNILFIAGVVLVSVRVKFIYRWLHAVIRWLGKIHLLKEPEKKYESAIQQLDSFHDGFETMGHSWKLYLAVCLITVVQLVFGSLDTYFIYRAFHLSGAPASQIVSAEVFATMVIAFVPLPGNAGGAELSFDAFCRIFFGSLTTPAMLVWRLLTYYGSIVFGLLYVSIGARKYLHTRPDSSAASLPPDGDAP